MTRRTPGDWKFVIGMTGNGMPERAIAHLACEFGVYSQNPVNPDEIRPNGYLLAASPNLLAACKALAYEAECTSNDHEHGRNLDLVGLRVALRQARAAIEKAEGKI